MRVLPLLTFLLASAVAGLAAPHTASASRTSNLPHAQATGASNNPLLTQEHVDFWIAKWQKRLALEDWQIEAKIVRVWDLPQSAVANIHWSLPKMAATIRVLSSADSSLRKREILKDTELSVVHELVHLSMSKLPLHPATAAVEEEAVKKLSAALLALDGGKK